VAAKKPRKKTKKEIVLAKIFDNAQLAEKLEAYGCEMGPNFPRALSTFLNYHIGQAAARAKANGRVVVEGHDIIIC
jgi:hypothetical protein